MAATAFLTIFVPILGAAFHSPSDQVIAGVRYLQYQPDKGQSVFKSSSSSFLLKICIIFILFCHIYFVIGMAMIKGRILYILKYLIYQDVWFLSLFLKTKRPKVFNALKKLH